MADTPFSNSLSKRGWPANSSGTQDIASLKDALGIADIVTPSEFQSGQSLQDIKLGALEAQQANLAVLVGTLLPGSITLGPLTLDNTHFERNVTFTANIAGKASGSTISVSSSDGSSLVVTGPVLSGSFIGSGAITVTLFESLPGALNTPNYSTISVDVSIPTAPTLGNLVLSGALRIGTFANVTITNWTAGSTITANIPGMGQPVFAGGSWSISGTPTGTAQTLTNGLVETLDGAVFSPKNNSVTVLASNLLNALDVDQALRIGVPVTVGIVGWTAGSTIASNIPGMGQPVFASGAWTMTGTPTGSAQTISNGLVETLAGYANNPNSSAITVQAAAPVYRIVALIGQSNMAGRGIIATGTDTNQANVKQYPDISADTGTYRTIRDSIQPLYHPENHAVAGPTNQLGPGATIGKRIAQTIAANEIVLLVPCAWGGTSLVSSAANSAPNPPQWGVGRSLYADAVSHINAAIAAAKALNPSSSIHSFHWIQGETDGDASVSQASYTTAFNAMVAGFRSSITGASTSTPFVIGGMMPEGITSHAGYPAIEAAHRQAVIDLTNVSYIPGPFAMNNGDTLHYNASGVRTIGTPMGSAAVGVPSVAFRTVAISQSEGNSGTTAYTYTIERSTKTGAVSVPWTFSAGTTNATDYVGGVIPTGGNVAIADGATTGTITINVQGDTTAEGTENFSLSLTAPTGYELGTRTTATGTILDEDSGSNLVANPRDQSAWTQASLTVALNVANDPSSGTATADRLTDNATNAAHSTSAQTTGAGSVTSGSTYTVAVDVLYETKQFIQVLATSAVFGTEVYANFDIQNGVVGSTGTGTTASITALTGGWYRCAITGAATASGSAAMGCKGSSTNTNTRGQLYVGTSQSWLIANAQIVAGSVANAYP